MLALVKQVDGLRGLSLRAWWSVRQSGAMVRSEVVEGGMKASPRIVIRERLKAG